MTKTIQTAKPKKAPKRYRVWFSQINQTMYDVEAQNADSAIAKAERKWRSENGPNFRAIQETAATGTAP